MRIRSIVEMDNGMKYCLPLDLAEVAYKISNSEGIVHVDAIHVKTKLLNCWDLESVVDNQNFYTKESILINPLHVISVIPVCIDLDEDKYIC